MVKPIEVDTTDSEFFERLRMAAQEEKPSDAATYWAIRVEQLPPSAWIRAQETWQRAMVFAESGLTALAAQFLSVGLASAVTLESDHYSPQLEGQLLQARRVFAMSLEARADNLEASLAGSGVRRVAIGMREQAAAIRTRRP